MGWRMWLAVASLLSVPVMAQTEETKTNEQDDALELVKQCILNEAIGGDGKQTLEELRKKCSDLDESKKLTALDKRKAREEVSKKNRNVITPHKRNYILPLSYVSITVAIDEDPSRTVQAAILEIHLTPPVS